MKEIPADLLFTLVLGHCLGDYLAQSLRMAIQKKYSLKWCTYHCTVYTAVVTLAVAYDLIRVTGSTTALSIFTIIIFASHLVLDKTDFVNQWLHLIGSRSYENAEKAVKESTSHIYSSYMISYTALVQAVADNTLHIALMYVGLRVLLNFFERVQ